MSKFTTEFEVPGGHSAVLMHSCCAPCSGPLIEKMANSGIDLTIFFYNPNIHPKRNMRSGKMKIYVLQRS